VIEISSLRADDAPDTLVIRFSIPVNDEKFYGDPRTSGMTALAEARRRYREEADRIADALERCAPGGLTDALFASMAARRAGILRVANERAVPS